VEKATVLKIIKRVSAGNPEFRQVLEIIEKVGEDQIQQLPDDKTAMVARRMVLAASSLVGRRMRVGDLTDKGPDYWSTEEGRVTGERIHKFVKTRLG